MRTPFLFLASMLIITAFSASLQADDHGDKMSFRVNPLDKTEWKAGPPSLPPGAQMVVLEGDPTKPGPFVFRVKVPDGYRIPLHTHPKTERVTVLQGTFHIGMADSKEHMDDSQAKAMKTGTYGYWAAGMKHFVFVKGETIAQFHGDGPWIINYVDPRDDPRNPSK